MINTTNNLLTVIALAERKHPNRPRYLCRCQCGAEVEVDHYHFISGHTKSCGCFKFFNNIDMRLTHGLSRTAEYKCWQAMKARCFNPKTTAYHCWGGRGVTVCEQWLNSFENFLRDMGQKPTRRHSLDRIDVNGNYEPSNCRWATTSDQGNNRRSTPLIEYRGEKLTLTQIARLNGVKPNDLNYRVYRKGAPLDAALAELTSRKSPYLYERPRLTADHT